MEVIPTPHPDPDYSPSEAKRPEAKQWVMTLNNYTEYDLVKFLTLVQPIADYYVYGKEVGEKCHTPHLQCFLCFQKTLRLTELKKIFPTAHFEIRWKNSSALRASLYCKKGDQSKEEWIIFREHGSHYGHNSDVTEWGRLPGGTTKQMVSEAYLDALNAPTLKEAMAIIKERVPRDYCLYGHTIKKNIEASLRPTQFTHKYVLDSYKHEPIDFDLVGTKSVFIQGDSNCGKTNWACAHFKNPLVVSRTDDLHKLTSDHDGIVFDDYSTLTWKPDSVIHLVDREFERSIPCRYNDAIIPANMRKIFTHNNANPFYLPETPAEQQVAIERRIYRIHITEKLF